MCDMRHTADLPVRPSTLPLSLDRLLSLFLALLSSFTATPQTASRPLSVTKLVEIEV